MTRPSRNIDSLLIETGRKMLPETGFRNMSIRQLCSNAGVNLGMFNYHFKTKDVFIERVLSDTYEEFFQSFTVEAARGGTPFEQLQNAVFSIAVFARDSRHIIAALIEEVMVGNERVIEFARKNLTKHIKVIVRLVKKCQKERYIIKLPLLNIFPTIFLGIVAPNVIVRLAEKKAVNNVNIKVWVKMLEQQVLTDKGIKQRIDVIFKGLKI